MVIFRVLFITLAISFSYIFPASAGEKINEIGKIIYSKETSSFHFIYVKNNQVYSHFLNEKNLKSIKNFVGKSVRVQGLLDWKKNTRDSFSLREQLTITEIIKFELDVLTFDSKNLIRQDSLVSHERKIKTSHSDGTISISDASANTLITAGAIAVGLLGGPITLVPTALMGIYQAID